MGGFERLVLPVLEIQPCDPLLLVTGHKESPASSTFHSLHAPDPWKREVLSFWDLEQPSSIASLLHSCGQDTDGHDDTNLPFSDGYE